MTGRARRRGATDAHEADRSATYREVFAVGEFRALFTAYLLSLIGDQLAKVALSILVFQRTNSALLAAVTFAVGYLPWLIGGPLLSAYADRLPRRLVLIACDVARCVLIGLMVIPGVPLWMLVSMLFLASLLTPPFEAARSALLPEVLDGDKYAVGISVSNMTTQLAQIAGFAAGGALVTVVSARGALAVDAVTFALSAVLIVLGVRERASPVRAAGKEGRSLLADSAEGLRFIVTNRSLLTLVLLLWTTLAFVYAQEGLAAPFAEDLGGGAPTAGLLLAANPVGMFIGGLLIGRFTRPRARDRLMRPLAVLSLLAILPIAFIGSAPVVMLLYAVSGLGTAFMIPLNVQLVQAVPPELRGRVFGVANTGLQAVQGMSVVLAGLAAEALSSGTVVSLSGAVGLVLVGLLVVRRRPAIVQPVEQVMDGAAGGAPAEPPTGESATEPAPDAHVPDREGRSRSDT